MSNVGIISAFVKPQFDIAKRHIELLTGNSNAEIAFRLIHDTRDNDGRNLIGTLADVWPEIERGQADGYGVFLVVNEGGQRAANISRVRALFVDADDVPLPPAWHCEPTFLVKRGPGRWHAYWLVGDLALEDFEEAQLRLAARYDTDTKVHDLPRVMRLAGSIHLKDAESPQAVTLTVCDDAWCLYGTYSGAEVLAGLPPVATRKHDKRQAFEGLIPDHPDNIRRAEKYLATHEPPASGERNHTTFKTACIVKDLGCSPEKTLELMLAWAPISDDFTEEEVSTCVWSAFHNGQNAPGTDAVQPSSEAFKNLVSNAHIAKLGSRLVVHRASELMPKPIEWMWRNRFPRASLSLIAGHGNLGKTTVLLDISARVTRGDKWPDGDGPVRQGSVIYFSGEDSMEHVLLPRFMAAGGDRQRLHFVSAVKREDGDGHRTFDLKADLVELERLITVIGDVELVILDPISSYFGNADTWRTSQVRSVLEPVAEMADRLQISIIGNTHFTKAGKGAATMRILDSVAITAVARSIYVVAQDAEEDERRLFLPSKWNLTKKHDGLTFTVDEKFVAVGVTGTFIKWGDAVAQSADEALAASEDKDRPKTELDGAVEFLREHLADGERLVTDVHFEAHQAGIALKTLKRARSLLKVERYKSKEVDGKWLMRLPSAYDRDD